MVMKKPFFGIFAIFVFILGAGVWYLAYDNRISFVAQEKVELFYYDSNKDKDESGNVLCSENGLVPVERNIPASETLIKDTIALLLAGDLSTQERARGIETEYPLEGLVLQGTSLRDGVLTLEFDDPNFKTGGGSCRVRILWLQIEATAKQFPEVQQVRFLPEELFQP